MTDAELKAKLQRSIDLAAGDIRDAGRRGEQVGPYVCATVELRIDDLRLAVRRLDALRGAITQALALIENDAPDMAVETLRAVFGGEEGP